MAGGGTGFRSSAMALWSWLRGARPGSTEAAELADILNSVPQVLWSASGDGRIEFISDQWSSEYGGDRAELLENGWKEFVHPDDLARTVATWEAALEEKHPFEAQYRIRVPDGDYRWILVGAIPSLDTAGNVTRWFGTCVNIHDRVLAEEALGEKERLYRGVLEASADCIKIISADGRIEFMNTPGLRLLELADTAVEGRLWWELAPEPMSGAVRDAVARAGLGHTVRFSGLCPTATGVANGGTSWSLRSATTTERSAGFSRSPATAPPSGRSRRRCAGQASMTR